MSEQNVELVRRTWQAFNNAGELDLDVIDPEVEWITLMEVTPRPPRTRRAAAAR